jgi:hypothetical protein
MLARVASNSVKAVRSFAMSPIAIDIELRPAVARRRTVPLRIMVSAWSTTSELDRILAFLAPDFIREVLEGKQPLGFSSDRCLRHSLPSNWKQQCDVDRHAKLTPLLG